MGVHIPCDGRSQSRIYPPPRSRLTSPHAVGKRVVVEGYPGKGKLAFCGPAAGSNGISTERFGVAFDEAEGKNDGTLAGKRYFTCEPNHGIFVAVDANRVKMAKRSSTSAPGNADGSGASGPRSVATLPSGSSPKLTDAVDVGHQFARGESRGLPELQKSLEISASEQAMAGLATAPEPAAASPDPDAHDDEKVESILTPEPAVAEAATGAVPANPRGDDSREPAGPAHTFAVGNDYRNPVALLSAGPAANRAPAAAPHEIVDYRVDAPDAADSDASAYESAEAAAMLTVEAGHGTENDFAGFGKAASPRFSPTFEPQSVMQPCRVCFALFCSSANFPRTSPTPRAAPIPACDVQEQASVLAQVASQKSTVMIFSMTVFGRRRQGTRSGSSIQRRR